MKQSEKLMKNSKNIAHLFEADFWIKIILKLKQQLINFVEKILTYLKSFIKKSIENFHTRRNLRKKINQKKKEAIEQYLKENPGKFVQLKYFFFMNLYQYVFPIADLFLSIGKFGKTAWVISMLTAIISFKYFYQSIGTIQSKDIIRKAELLPNPTKNMPQYYNDKNRQQHLSYLTLPTPISNGRSVSSLQADISLVFSNRSAKKYFDQNKVIFFDRLQMNLEPFSTSISTKPNGKKVIKEAILREINSVLAEKNVDGVAQDVKFEHILAN